MIVLWILVLLTALATEFAYSMRTETNTTRNYKEDVESYYLAQAGINLAMAEILQEARFHSINDTQGFLIGKPLESEVQAGEEEVEEETAYRIVNREDIPLGNGTVSYQISDENGKLNLNKVDRGILIKVLRASGIEVGEERDIIADSILDWIDKDDNHRINGAENSYYQGLNPPYKAKNDEFHSVDELIKVRGITEEILYGSPEPEEGIEEDAIQYVGLEKFFTIQNVPFFNPNTADPEVLKVNYSESQIQDILEKKNERGYFNQSLSTHFKIISTGKIDGSRTNHSIVAIIEKFGLSDDAVLLIRYWNDSSIES